MSKRISLQALLYALLVLCLAILGCCALNSGFAAVIEKQADLWQPETGRLYAIDRSFSSETGESGKILHGSLNIASGIGEGWRLYIPNGQYCSEVEINGELYKPSAGADSYLFPVQPGTVNEVRIVYPQTGDPGFCNAQIYLASEEYAIELQHMGGYQRFFIIGMSAVLVLYALSLYGVKRSEKYLLLFAFLAYSTSARTLGNALPILKQYPLSNILLLGAVNFPWLNAAENHNLMFTVVKTLIAVLRIQLISEFLTVKKYSPVCIKISIAGAAAVMLCCVMGFGYYPIQIWLAAVHLMELFLIITGGIVHFEDRYVLLTAWAFTLGLRVFDVCCVSGLLPHGMLEAAIKPQGIIETFYVIAFVFVINRKFAAKFKEADTLSRSLEEINRNLEKIVDERTAELEDTCSQLQLVQNQKSEFIANIVHNLKSPLFSLYGYTDMALDSLDGDREYTRRCLQEINSNTEYVRQLIEKLSLCMRLENSSVQFNKVPLNIKTLLEQVLSTSVPNAEAKNIQLNVNVADETLSTEGDALYLRQAVQNIVDNGIRHSGSNSQINLSARREGGMAAICIRDEGEGMSEEQRKLIFGRYYSQNKSGATSSGLGLTIAMEIVTQHGGSITVESKLGEGSAFTILLPALPGQAQ